MGYPSQTQRCWRNGNVFRRRPRTETIARLEKWVIVGSSVLACLVDSGLKPNPKPSTKCNLICNYVMWWQTDPLSGFCRSFSSLVCFGGSIDVSKHWNKPGPTLQALTVNMHTRNGKWNAFIWEVEEEFSCYVIQQAELIAKPISQLLYIFSAIQDWSNVRFLTWKPDRLLLLCTSWGHCVSSHWHIQNKCEWVIRAPQLVTQHGRHRRQHLNQHLLQRSFHIKHKL